jgi:hypothetical protein
MRPNSLILATVVGSALIGTGVALTSALRSTPIHTSAIAPVAQAPTAVLPVASQPVPLQPTAVPISPSLAPAASTPIAQVTTQPPTAEPLFPPPAPSPDPNLAVAANPETANPALANSISPLRTQLRRAIQERNLTMLRSLLQAGSLRGALRDIEVQEQINLDNLDASAWRILEKAITYRCRQSQANGEQSACFE